MLSDEVINKVVERLVNRIEQGNEYILSMIGKTIKEIRDIKPSQAEKLGQIIRFGGDYAKIAERLAEITKLNIKDIYKIFEEVAKSDYAFAKQFYEYRNKKYIPYNKNVFLKKQVEAMARMTSNEYVNLTKTLAFAERRKDKIVYTDIAKRYQEIIDEAVLNVSQGKENFDNAMYRSIKKLGSSGIRTVDYPSGRSMRLDSAIRMQMRGAISEMHEKVQDIFGEEYGADGKEITVHENPAPDHAEVQGHQFAIKEFEKFQNDKDSKDVNGVLFPAEFNGRDRRAIGQYNCYHDTYNIVVGVSTPQYTPEQLQEIINKNNEGFEFEGEHYTNYEGTQLQRKLELEIRKEKDLQILAKASDNKQLIGETQERITQLTRKYRDLSKTSGLPEYMERMRVSGYRRTKVDKNSVVSPIAKLNNYQKIIDSEGIKSIEYNNLFNDYKAFYNSLDDDETTRVLNKMEDYKKRIDVKQSNPMGEFINEKLGYDKKPEIISGKEFFVDENGNTTNDYILLDENHIYRGLKDYDKEKTADDINEFKYGKFYAGSGIEGNGTYTTSSYATALEYAIDKNDEYVLKMILDDKAKIISFNNIDEIKRNIVKYGKNIKDDKFRKFSEYVLTDNGYIASLLGFDVIKGKNIVVLNRGKIKVLK